METDKLTLYSLTYSHRAFTLTRSIQFRNGVFSLYQWIFRLISGRLISVVNNSARMIFFFFSVECAVVCKLLSLVNDLRGECITTHQPSTCVPRGWNYLLWRVSCICYSPRAEQHNLYISSGFIPIINRMCKPKRTPTVALIRTNNIRFSQF